MEMTSAMRVPAHTNDAVNRAILARTAASVRWHEAHPDEIDLRLRALDEEWDVERWVETLAPSFTLLGLSLGLTKDKRWFLLPLVVQGFFLQHALQGWCPPVPVLRQFGVRTTQEIEHERRKTA